MMKKLISVLLTIAILVAVAVPAMAAAVNPELVPMIYIRGNGEAIYDENGNQVTVDLDTLSVNGNTDGIDKDTIIESCANILLPFLTEGLLMDKWDSYGDALYEEIAPLFEKGHLDGNGNPMYGTGVHPNVLASSEAAAKRNYGSDGRFDLYDYSFAYDWRLSPYDHVDRLHTYVQTVMASTGAKQVSIVARCFGGSLLMAYLEKYGSLGHVKNAFFADVLSNGTATISHAMSGKLYFDSNALYRYMNNLTYCGQTGVGNGFVLTDLVTEIIFTTVDLFNQVGITDTFIGSVELLYQKLYEALMPALLSAVGMATQANYWTCIYEEDFEDAIILMFGDENDARRTEYAGLIEKIRYYYDHVTSCLPELYKTFSEDYGIHIGFTAKYGYTNAPYGPGQNDMTDALVSLKDAAYGATCAEVHKTLSDEYIQSRIDAGYSAYISPDKKVDLSTCAFPDTTWIVKNAHHNHFEATGEQIAADFCRSTGMTVQNNADYPQFAVFDDTTNTWTAMTEDNCADFDWLHVAQEQPTKITRLQALFRWLYAIIPVIIAWFSSLFGN